MHSINNGLGRNTEQANGIRLAIFTKNETTCNMCCQG